MKFRFATFDFGIASCKLREEMPKRNPKMQERMVVTSVRLTHAEHQALQAIAALDRRSLSDEIRFLIAERAELISHNGNGNRVVA